MAWIMLNASRGMSASEVEEMSSEAFEETFECYWESIANFMDNDIREDLHYDAVNEEWSHQKFLIEYLKKATEDLYF